VVNSRYTKLSDKDLIGVLYLNNKECCNLYLKLDVVNIMLSQRENCDNYTKS